MRIDPFNSSREAWLQNKFGWLLAAALLVNACGLWVTILEPDGALYASIARTMAVTGDFINLRAEGLDWLDKPHFPFWMAALSFRLFGISGFAYKFPAFLFWAAGGYYTYRFALSLYGKEEERGRWGRSVAQLAALIYVSAAHLVISNNDVRAEPYLTGLVIGSVYHFYRASRSGPGLHLVAGAVLAACAVMTKGPFVLVTIGSGFVVDWVLSKQWRQFLHPRWWIALGLIGIFILPELYCLHIQFDLHPEKTIFGHKGVSGIRWFFWDSQFGRFFNTGPIRGSGDPLFYFHTLLWAFLPWSILLYAAIFVRCRNWKRAILPGDAIAPGAALVSSTMFSLSRFQLPHYLNILFPFFAILTASWLCGLYKQTALRIVGIVQNIISLLLALLLTTLCWWFHFRNGGLILGSLALLSVLIFLLFRNGGEGHSLGDQRAEKGLRSAIGRSFCMALLAYAFINLCLYPALLDYQAGSEAAKYLKGADQPEEMKREDAEVYMLREASIDYSFEFYCSVPIRWIGIDSLSAKKPVLLFLPTPFGDSLTRRGYAVQERKRFPNFHISQLTGQFIDPGTREATLTRFSLVSVKDR